MTKKSTETIEEATIRKTLQTVANFADRSMKKSWKRKQDNIAKIAAKLTPIQEQIQELEETKLPILDELQELREVMIRECIHPYNFLVHMETHIICSFCNKKISIPHGD